MAHRVMRDEEQDGWERSDFPIVCETCLGPNPYVRMQRINYGAECHISGRPYTVFRWRPGNDARYKKTIICQEVAKAKNVCQVCLLDLDYNLPVQARDSALGVEDEVLPESDVGKEYALQKMQADGTLTADSSFAKAKANDAILRMQRTTPYYKRNRAPICSFFVRGECKRGAECPYRHEMPTTGELAEQNIKDRYYGVNDPVARKMLSRVDAMPKLEPPEDSTITTLYVGGLAPGVAEGDLRDQFYPFGEIRSIRILETRHCAFVTFAERGPAERAAEGLQNKLIIRGQRAKLCWGKPQERRADAPPASAPPPSMMPPQVAAQAGFGAAPPFIPPPGPNFFNLPRPAGPAYPSMDPLQAGTRVPAPGTEGDSKRHAADAAPADEPAPLGAEKRPRQGEPGGYPPAATYGGPMGGPLLYGGPMPGGPGGAYGAGRPPGMPMMGYGGPPPGWRPPVGFGGAGPGPMGGSMGGLGRPPFMGAPDGGSGPPPFAQPPIAAPQ